MDRATRKVVRRCQNHKYRAALEKLYICPQEPRWQRAPECRTNVGERSSLSREQPGPSDQGAMRLQARLTKMGKYSYVSEAQQALDKYDLGVTLAPLVAPGEETETARCAALVSDLGTL